MLNLAPLPLLHYYHNGNTDFKINMEYNSIDWYFLHRIMFFQRKYQYM